MEEKNKENSTIKNGISFIVGAFIVGYILGGASAGKNITDSYNRGFMDAFDTILSRSK